MRMRKNMLKNFRGKLSSLLVFLVPLNLLASDTTQQAPTSARVIVAIILIAVYATILYVLYNLVRIKNASE